MQRIGCLIRGHELYKQVYNRRGETHRRHNSHRHRRYHIRHDSYNCRHNCHRQCCHTNIIIT